MHAWLDDVRKTALLAIDDEGHAIGFAELALRGDYVNGTHGSPVGFLEAWYVAPEWRGCGVGRALIVAAEGWARTRGCAELASDALLDNTASHAAHAGCGFEETERVVYFRKVLA
jgi:aminoglycoside 6'-N-acetyltransferase I